ncbi:MAG: PAS domain S-box protein, partial [Spirochaetes bacterium]|nr:PAS domain S-box protein [Spirochaetota bacterium]
MQRGEASGQHGTGHFLLDAGGKIREIDAASALLLGIDRVELVGRSFRSFVCRAMKSTFSLLLKETASNGGKRSCTLELSRPCLVRLSLSARRGDARGVVAGDIAELKLPEKEGRKRGQSSAAADLLAPSESEKLFRSLAENTHDAMARFDRKLRHLYVNPVVEKVTGMAASAFIGRTNRELRMPNENTAFWDAKLRRVFASGQRTTLEFEYHSPEGTRFFSSLLVPELDEDGLVKSVLSVARDITEAKRSEEAYRTLVDNSLQGLVIIQDGRIVFYNKAFVALSGYSREELHRLSPHKLAAVVHPADRPRVLAAMSDRLGGKKEPAIQEFRFITKSGQIRHVETCFAITQFNGRQALQISYMDITERLESRDALRESEQKLRSLIEQSIQGIALIDSAGKITEWNHAMEMITNLPASEMIGKDAKELHHLLGVEVPSSREESFKREFERQISTASGKRDLLLVNQFPIHLTDGFISAVLVQEITERKVAEEKLKESQSKLRNLAIHLLSAREQERKKVAQEIHDELGQVLTALKMDLRWLEKRLDPSQAHLLEKMRGMISLTDQTIQRVQKISSELRPRMLDDLGLAAAIEWLMGDFSRRTGIRCKTAVQVTQSRIGGNSATAIYRIVQEALTNISRHASASRVSVLLREVDERFEVLIRDDGIGISKTQATDARSFGLIGIRERAQGLGGKVSIRGRTEKGTTVAISIPYPGGGNL